MTAREAERLRAAGEGAKLARGERAAARALAGEKRLSVPEGDGGRSLASGGRRRSSRFSTAGGGNAQRS